MLERSTRVKRLYDEIVEALEEARIMECARDEYDEEHVMCVAQKLSGAPLHFVEEIANQRLTF